MARVDLNPVEEARACAMLVEDLGITKEEVGRRVGSSRVAVSNLIRLLELPDEVLELIEAGALSEGHGRALLMARTTTSASASRAAPRDGGWSVRETERRAKADGHAPEEDGARSSCIPTSRMRWPPPRTRFSAALGRGGPGEGRAASGCRAEIEFDGPGEAIALAERLPARRLRPQARRGLSQGR